MNTTEYGDITPRMAAESVARLLTRGQTRLILERFGQMDPQPKNKTKTRKWRRYESLPLATSPLAEGIPPEGSQLSSTDVTATLEFYGDWTPITNIVVDLHEDPVLMEAEKLLAEQIANTVETLRWNVLKAGTNVFYANVAANRAAVNSPPLRGDFRRIVRYFNRHDAKPVTEIIKASPLISTEPVEASFIAFAHTDLESDIRGIPGFVPVVQYSASVKAYEHEIGKVENVRILTSRLFSPWLAAGTAGTDYLSSGDTPASSLACDVYPIVVIAQDAYGIVPLQGMNAVKPAVVNPKPTHGNPLGQLGFVSWGRYDAAAILNQTWCARLECACTAVPA